MNTGFRSRKGRLTAVFVLLIALLFSGALAAVRTEAQGARGIVRLPGHVPAPAFIARRAGAVAADEPIGLALTLPLRNQAELQRLLARMYDPNDPLYGQFLTSEEFQARFAPTEAQYAAVAAYARSRGLTVTGTHPNRLLLDVAGPAGAVENAFATRLARFQSVTGKLFRAPEAEPAIPAVLAGSLAGVVGLDDLATRRPHLVRLQPALVGHATPHLGTGPQGGLSPSDIRAAYNLSGESHDGAGQTLAVFELDGYDPSDITEYETTFGLSHVPLQNVLVDGFSGKAGDGSDEVTLDLELQIALASGASKIFVYEGPNSDAGVLDTYNRIATDNAAKSISSCWGLPERENTTSARNTEHAIFLQMAAQGQTLVASSGDAGAYDDGRTLSVDDPASQPYVTGVGGTTLSTSSAGGAWSSETVWNAGSAANGGSGGGISVLWPIPSYQSGAVSSTSKGSTTARNVPDVSLDADPNTGYAIFTGGQWAVFGGTSCAAPVWAAFAALVNQSRAAAGKGTVGFLNPLLYAIGRGSHYAADFHDQADGRTNFFYPGVTGYDDATGWGSLNGAGLLADLTSGSTGSGPALTNLQLSSTSLPAAGGTVSVSANVTAAAGVSSVSVTVTPPSGSSSTTSLTRVGTSSVYGGGVTLPANSGAASARYAITVSARDADGNTASASAGSVTVAAKNSSHDTTAPAIPSCGLTPTSLPATGGTVTISATATDNLAVASVTATVRKPDGSSVQLPLVHGAGDSYHASYAAPANVSRSGESYQVTLLALDTSSNSKSANCGSFQVAADTSRPILKDATVTPRRLSSRGGVVTLRVTATDNVAVASVTATIDRPRGADVVFTLAHGAGNTYTGAFMAPRNTAHAAKSFSVSLRAEDTSGNASTVLRAGKFVVRSR